jgi:hypothetical protein
MTNGVVIGRLVAIEPGHIVLEGHVSSVRIMAPAAVSPVTFPIGCNLTVSVHQDGNMIIAKSISRDEDQLS